MEIVPYAPDLAPAIAAFYNDLVRGVPHCHPTAPGHWRELLLPVVEPGRQSSYPFHSRLVEQQVLVAREGDRVLGIAHNAIRRPKKRRGKDPKPDRGLIPFLAYAPGHRGVGQALLDAAETFLRQRGITRAHAFHGTNTYPFYHMNKAGLSEHLPHIQALLELNGYEREHGEVFLEWKDFAAAVPPLLDHYGEIDVRYIKEGKNPLPNITVEAQQGDKSLGICGGTSFNHFNPLTPESDWFYYQWLGVEREVEGQGLGGYLLHRTLAEARAAGYRHAVIPTGHDNHRALLFYSNHGFRFVDWTYQYARDLG